VVLPGPSDLEGSGWRLPVASWRPATGVPGPASGYGGGSALSGLRKPST